MQWVVSGHTWLLEEAGFMRSSDLQSKGDRTVQTVNLAKLEEEMRQFAEERIQSVAGDAPMLTTTQLAEIWDRSPRWITRMRAAGRVPSVPFGGWDQTPRAVAVMGLVRGI
jgi:hypothetical protein